jgi:hypothetical protein
MLHSKNLLKSSDSSIMTFWIIAILLTVTLFIGRWDYTRVLYDKATIDYLASLQPYPYAWSIFYWKVQGRLYFQAMLFLSLLFLMRRPRVKQYESPRILLYLYLLFCCYFALSIIWSSSPRDGLGKTMDLVYSILLLFSIYAVQNKHDIRYHFYQVIMFVSILMALGALYSTIMNPTSSRLSAFGGGPNIFGRTMAFGFIIALEKGITSKRMGLTLIFVPITFIMLLASGSRGAMGACVCGVICLLFARGPHISRVIGLCLCTMVVISAFIFLSPAGERIAASVEDRIGTQTIEKRYISGRDELAKEAITMWEKSPVLGNGLGGFAAGNFEQEYPHNLFLEALCEGGVIGTFFLIIVLVYGIFWLYNHRRRLHILSLALLCTSLIAAQFSGDFYDCRMIFVFLLLALYPIEKRVNSFSMITQQNAYKKIIQF